MNLGAKTEIITLLNQNDAIGTYHRVGYRDPYFKNAAGNYGYFGDEFKVKADWGGTDKSRTDPCPPGYRVPSTSAWDGLQLAIKRHDPTTNSFLFYPLVYYPYSGYVNDKNDLKSGIQGEGATPSNFDDDILFPSNQNYTTSNPKNKTAYKLVVNSQKF